MYTTELNRIIVDADDLDVKATLECGQLFRFEKTTDGYTVRSGSKVCDVRTAGDKVYIDTKSVNYFVNFFNLDRDILRTKRELARYPELQDAINSCGALRILHQPLFETIISFIISANNNIPRIKSIINRICAAFDGAFPTPEQLAGMPIRQLDSFGCGFRSKYILASSKICAETGLLNSLYAAPTPEAQRLLMTLPGVGQKVADCVTLFALGRLDVCPVDTWIFKTQRVGTESVMQVRSRIMERYGENAGYAQQLIFYYNAILKKGQV